MTELSRADDLLAKMRADAESDWVTRLLNSIRDAPVVDEALLGETRAAAGEPLGFQQRRVVEATSYGLTREMVADLLDLSPETVKRHLDVVRAKFRAKNTVHACCMALRNGWIK